MNEDLFVEAWKKGVEKTGLEFFNIKASSLSAAKKKWQLEPNYEFIQNAMGGYSHGKQVLLGLMYSFFNAEDGQKILEKAGTPNFIQARATLDQESLEIIAQLWVNHTGW